MFQDLQNIKGKCHIKIITKSVVCKSSVVSVDCEFLGRHTFFYGMINFFQIALENVGTTLTIAQSSGYIPRIACKEEQQMTTPPGHAHKWYLNSLLVAASSVTLLMSLPVWTHLRTPHTLQLGKLMHYRYLLAYLC